MIDVRMDFESYYNVDSEEKIELIKQMLIKAIQKVKSKGKFDWKLMLISTTKDSIIGDCDYLIALEKLGKYVLDSHANTILVKALTLEESEKIQRRRILE